MAQEVDWISSQAGMCKVNLYSPSGHKDQERKVICFVDVSNLNSKDKHSPSNLDSGQSGNISDPPNELDLVNLEEKEVIIIKDNEQSKQANTEGAVCLFKQGSSEEFNVVSWLSNDLQKYAVGFQHALTPMKTAHKTNVFDLSIAEKISQNNNNTAPNTPGSEKTTSDDLAYYAHKLCNLVIEITRKEIKDKWESSGKCIRQTISPHSVGAKPPSTEGIQASNISKEKCVRLEDPYTGETTSLNDFKQEERYADKVKRHDDFTSVSRGMMVCANQVASDMMMSFLKTMKVQKGKHSPPACAVLKEVLLKHTREIVSDLIDSSMKNLHNVTGALMTDSDFVCGLKKNLFRAGTQKTTEVLEVMVKRLFKLLSGDDKLPLSQSLAFAAFKSGGQANQRAQGMQFASLKSEAFSHGKDKGGGSRKSHSTGNRGIDKGSLDVYAKELLLTALMQIQQHLLERKRDCVPRDSNTVGYRHRDSNYDRRVGSYNARHTSKPPEGRSDLHQSECLKEKGNLILSVIQKILCETGMNLEDNYCDKNRG
ncbi:A-kinase anchor protein 4-like [Hemicordylus capensis]|uniref:A-kinase anchor protein 4-like n=1 Tax=Hemicordylus capensis TaxID=884348 RepID=UPI002301FF54|nr:A-kinase anchor protein 4-like [Hemicordylus capensis]